MDKIFILKIFMLIIFPLLVIILIYSILFYVVAMILWLGLFLAIPPYKHIDKVVKNE